MRRILLVNAWRQLIIAVGVTVLAAGMAGFSGHAAAASPGNPGSPSSQSGPSRTAGTGTGTARETVPVPQWPSGGQGLADDRFQPDEATINAKKAATPIPRWNLTMAGAVSATPAVVNGVVYVPDWGGYLSAIKASNRHLIWRRQISSSYDGVADSVSRTDPVVDGSTLIIGTQLGADVIAISTATGAMKWITLADPHPKAIITGSPISYRGSSTWASRQARRVPPSNRATAAAPSAAASSPCARQPARCCGRPTRCPPAAGSPVVTAAERSGAARPSSTRRPTPSMSGPATTTRSRPRPARARRTR